MATTRLLSAMVATWNNAATTFTGLKFNVTDTASASGSLLMDLQVGGISQANVLKSGVGIARVEWQAPSVWATSILYLGSGADVALRRDAANTLALRNGTAEQSFNVYNTYTDASNYERAVLRWSGNALIIGTENLGTGTLRATTLTGSTVSLKSGATSRWQVDTSGNYITFSDNTYDIGASGANRPRSGYFGTTVQAAQFNATAAGYQNNAAASFYWNGRSQIQSTADAVVRLANSAGTITTDITLSGASSTGTSTATFGGSILGAGNVRAGAGSYFYFNGGSQIGSPADGNVLLQNSGGSTFGLLQFGGTTSSFPALKRSGAQLELRLADDTGFAPLKASVIKTDAVTVATLPSAASAGEGGRSFVTDATATTFMSTVAGGGANKVPVISDGTNWLIG